MLPPFPFHIWCIPPRCVGGEAYINLDAGGGAAQSSRRRCSVVLGSCCLSACARVRGHGLKRYVRARGGGGLAAWGFVPSQLGFCFSVGAGRRSHVGSSLTTVAGSSERGGRGEAHVAILFRSSGAFRRVGGSCLRSPFT